MVIKPTVIQETLFTFKQLKAWLLFTANIYHHTALQQPLRITTRKQKSNISVPIKVLAYQGYQANGSLIKAW